MSGAVSLTLGAHHSVVCLLMHGKALANVLFSVMALSVAAFTLLALSLLPAENVAQFAVRHHWLLVPLFLSVASLVEFILFYFRSGSRWLA